MEDLDKKIIKLEDCYQNPDAFTDMPEPKPHKMKDLFKIIKEESKKEDIEYTDSDSSSDRSDFETLTKEKEAIIIKNILLEIKKTPSENLAQEKVINSATHKEIEKFPKRVLTAAHPERFKEKIKRIHNKAQKHAKLREVEFPKVSDEIPFRGGLIQNVMKRRDSLMKSNK